MIFTSQIVTAKPNIRFAYIIPMGMILIFGSTSSRKLMINGISTAKTCSRLRSLRTVMILGLKSSSFVRKWIRRLGKRRSSNPMRPKTSGKKALVHQFANGKIINGTTLIHSLTKTYFSLKSKLTQFLVSLIGWILRST